MKLTTKVLVPILAISLSQIARAVVIDTFQSGNWSNPASWNGGAFPDTYAGDSATINLGHTIDFDDITAGASYNGTLTTPMSPFHPAGSGSGGLAVGASSVILIDGGTLTQSALQIEIRIGEGSAAPGDGTLTIQNGGTFNSGAAIGVGVGTSLDANLGSGIVNVIDGSFIMGAGAVTGGLGVGLDGSTGVINVGDNAGGAGTAILDLAANNIGMGIGYNFATATGGIGRVIVSADGKIKLGTAGIVVGKSGGTGALTILSGGQLIGIGNGGITVGDNLAGTKGALKVSGGTITSSGELRINAVGIVDPLFPLVPVYGFDMSGGTASVTTTGEFNIGRDAGRTGSGKLSGGAVSASLFSVGRDSGLGTFTMTGGSVAASGQFVVGQNSGAANSATISAGGVTSGAETRVGEGTGANGTLNISGTGALTSGGELQVGNDAGNGTLNMSGGSITANSWVAIGRNGGTGIVNLSGGTITKSAGQSFDIGVFGGNGNPFGTGTINQSGGSIVNTGSDTNIGRDGSGMGFWNMNGGTATLATLNVGNNGQGTLIMDGVGTDITASGESHIGTNSGSVGVMTVRNGAAVHFNGGWAAKVGTNGGSDGTVNVETGGKFIATNSWVVIGAESGSTGAMNISDTTNAGTLVDVSNGEGRFITARLGTATVNQSGGAVKAGNWFAIGIDPGGNGTYNMSGGTVASQSNVDIANRGTGTMNISSGNAAGTTITNLTGGVLNAFNVGADTGGNGTLNIALANATDKIVSRELYAGNNATTVGVININKGILQTNEWAEIGRNGGTGTINITGPNSRWERGTLAGGQAKDVQIGWNGGTGTMNVTAGGTMNTNWWLSLGRRNSANGTALVDGAGSKINLTGNGDVRLNVGGDPDGADTGTGLLTVSNGGAVNKTGDGGEWNVGMHATSIGTVTVSTGGTITTNTGDTFIGRDGGTGTLNISGAGSIVSTSAGGGGSQVHVGIGGASNGTVNIAAGGKLTTNQGWFGVGQDSSTGVVTVDGAGSSLTARGIIVGWSGTGNGTINIQNGAVVTNANTPGGGPELSMGRDNATATGTINILSGGTLNAGRAFRIGANGFGTVNINAGTFNGSAGDWSYIGDGGSSHGAVNMTNGTFTFNDSLMIANNNGAHGTFTQDGAASTTLIGNELNIGRSGGIGVVNVNGGTFQVNGWTTMGRDGNSGSGTLNVSNGGVFTHAQHNGGDFLIGWTNGSTGAVNVTNGGTVNYSWWTRVGVDPGSTGSILVDNGSTFHQTGGRTYIGEKATGSLTITHNSHYIADNSVSDGDVFKVGGGDGGGDAGHGTLVIDATSSLSTFDRVSIGDGVNGGVPATGTVTLTGGSITAFTGGGGDFFRVGTRGGTGTMNVSAGGTVNTNAGWFTLGENNGSVGTATFTGAGTTLTSRGLIVGWNGTGATGTLNIQNNAVVNNSGHEVSIGRDFNGSLANSPTGTVTVSGGGVLNAGSNGGIRIGHGTTGSLTVTGAGSLVTGSDFIVADGANSSGTVLIQNGGGVTTTGGNFRVANSAGSTGMMTINGTGTVVLQSVNETIIGNGVGANGTLTVTDPNTTITTGGEFQVGNDGGTGVANISAGTLNLLGYMAIGRNTNGNGGANGGNGTLNLSGAAVINKVNGNGTFDIGSWNGGNNATVNTTGTLNQTGGTINNTVSDTHIGRDTGVVGVWNLGTGTATLARLNVGNNGIGTLNMGGGSISASDRVSIAANGGSTGTANLNGGVLTTQFVEAGGGTVALNMNGGTLRAFGNEGNFLRGFNPANSAIGTGGVIFDSNTFNISVNSQLAGVAGDGGLTKISNGTLTLTAQNLYTGVTKLNGGSVNVGSAESAGVSGPLGTSAAANPGSIVFGGGTLQYSAANQNDYSGRFSTAVNQAYRVDTNSQSVTWATSLVSSGGSLTKFGNGTLFLPVANTYTAGTTIHGGTVNITGNAALGAPAGGVTIDNNAILQAATPVTTSRTITLGAGGGTIDTNGNNVTLTNTSTVTGIPGAALTHTGAGNLDIKGTQTYAILNANGGLTTLDSALGTGTSTINANATTQINASQTLAALNIADGVEVTFGDSLPFAPEPPKPSAPFGSGGAGLVPEPGSLGLLLVGAVGFIARRRRSR